MVRKLNQVSQSTKHAKQQSTRSNLKQKPLRKNPDNTELLTAELKAKIRMIEGFPSITTKVWKKVVLQHYKWYEKMTSN